MRLNRFAVPALVAGLLWAIPLHGQGTTGTITGRVIDSTTQQPLSGVSIQVVVAAGETARVELALSAHAMLLDAVVATGYGTQSRRDATGSVVAITEQDFNRGVISSPEQLLHGRMAGVQVTMASGEPGAGANIRIRGTSSVRAGNQPLFVVDGVPLTGGPAQPGGPDYGAGTQSPRNPLVFLNPDNTENISVLKDASAAAIYGSRGSNGVVLITTKRGTAGP